MTDQNYSDGPDECDICGDYLPDGHKTRLCDECTKTLDAHQAIEAGADSPPPWRWLESTERLQAEVYGVSWQQLGRSPGAVAESLTDNVFATFVEVGELTREFSWKGWAQDEAFVNRDAAIKEIVDIVHFVGNMLVALDVDDDEWAELYQAKQAVNAARQRDGYTVAQREVLADAERVLSHLKEDA